jgi:adenylate cyclase
MRGSAIRKTLLFQVICWVLAGLFYLSTRLLGLEDQDRIRLVLPIRWGLAITQFVSAGIFIGLILGLVDLSLDRSSIRKRSFGFLVVVKGLIYILSILVTISVIHVISYIFVDGLSLQQELKKLGEFYTQRFLLSLIIYALVISFLVSFIKQVNQKFGPGILGPLVLGKYFKPKEEERIFMFLDLRSSTTHAEKIGHVLYSEMIQDCFYDLATVVEKHLAEIYQYVGDEVVLTWKMKNGLQNQNCLRLFFAFDDVLRSRNEHYLQKYGFTPEFKAGVNSGEVVVAEIGEIKKEIAYHGDVLNTAARIQSKCNDYGKNLLVSEVLKNKLSAAGDIQFEFLGSDELKGKTERVNIYSAVRKPV